MAGEDPKWIRVQKKTFTKWVNMHLAKKRTSVADLASGFADGTSLATLLTILTEHDFGKKIRAAEKCKMSIHKTENIAQCLSFIEKEKGVRLLNIGAGDIHAGNEKLLLALVWLLILNLDVQELSDEALNAKEALMMWCQKATKGYENVQVKDFHNSWGNGLAFCALIHKHKPGMLDFNSLDPADDAGNLEKAFAAAEELGIPRLLDVEDIVGEKPDEKSVMTYLFQWYRYFNAGNKGETAGRRVGKLVAMTKQNDALKAEYTTRSSDFAKWTTDKTSEIGGLDAGNSLAGVQGAIATFNTYKSQEKPPKAAEKSELEALLNSIQIKLKSAGRPPFAPADGHSAEDVKALWQGLLAAEQSKGATLKAELKRQRLLEDLVKRFNRIATKLEGDLSTADTYLGTEEKIDTVTAAESRLQLHKGFVANHDTSLKSVAAANDLAQRIDGLNYAEKDSINSRAADLTAKFDDCKARGDAKQAALEASLALELKKNVVRKEYADVAKDAKSYYKKAGLDIHTSGFGSSLAAVQAHKAVLDAETEEIRAAANAQISGVTGKDAELSELAVSDNEYTAIKTEDVQKEHDELTAKLEAREAGYVKALADAVDLEARRKEFAEAAHELQAFLDSHFAEIEASTGTDDEKKAAAEALWQNGGEAGPKLEMVKALDAEIKGMVVHVSNDHTELTSADLDRLHTAYNNRASNFIATCEENSRYAARTAEAEAARAAASKSEQHAVDFASYSQQLFGWFSSVDDNIGDDLAALESQEQVDQQIASHAISAGELPANQAKLNDLQALHSTMTESGNTNFGGYDVEQVVGTFTAISDCLTARVAELGSATEKQTADEALRTAYVTAADDFNAFLTTQKDAVAEEGKGDLNEQLVAATQLQRTRNAGGIEKVGAIQAAQDALGGAEVSADDKTDLTPEGLTAEFEQLGEAIENKIKLIENEIAKASESEIPPEKIAEFKEVFEHFDRNQNGSLSHLEFKGCLVSLGEDPTDAELDALMKKLDTDASGVINFTEFIQHMIAISQDQDSEDEILSSFKVITNDADFITEEQMRQVMQPDEVDYLMAEMPAVDGGYDYKTWAAGAFAR